ncbi:MAG: DUF5317 domain-containing protein [Clostridiales bacterium]|nr:DUF5317 domain-containing protein [Clostridiales bacterium]
MILEALFLGVIAGKIRGGDFKKLGYVFLRLPYILILSFILMIGTSLLVFLGNKVVIDNRIYIYIVAYFLLFTVLFLNLHNKAIWLILLGAVANFTAIVLNQGSMPIDLLVLEKLGLVNMVNLIKEGEILSYIPIQDASTYTEYLAKRFALPSFYPLKHVMSIGDLLVSLGLFLYIQKIMQSRVYRRTSRMLRHDYR